MRPVETDVESLLVKERRAALSLREQLLLYFDPFALFKDASRGPAPARELARRYNRAMRWILVAYMRRWAALAAALFLAIMPAEALAAQERMFMIPAAAFAVGCSIALVVSVAIATVYLLLGARE